MEYTIIANDRSYVLPKKTISVVSRLDDVLKVDSIKGLSVRQKFEKLHIFSKDLLGEENCREIFGSENLDEIDLSELTITVRKINDAYEKPIADYAMEQSREKLASIPMEKITSITKAAQSVANMEMLKKQ